MTCPACHHENRDGAKFCEECAAPLKRACSSCGAELRPTAKFCDECAAPVGRPAPGPQHTRDEKTDGTRKVVSFIFADLAGSTALHERLDAESARLFMEGYYRAMRGAVEAHGGKVAKLLGDGVMAVFGLPLVAEDDAIRAVRAAIDMQRVFRELAEWHSNLVGKVGLRVAVNTGEVVAKDESELIGDPVNVAARLQDQARDGDVVIGESTRRLVAALVTLEPLGSLSLKGRAEAVGAYRVVSLERPVSATTTAFVGRDDELARLTAVHETAIRTPAARLTVLLGSPGLGKSRLIGEFVRRAGESASVITGHCGTAGGTSFAPVTLALRRFLGLDDGATPEVLREAVDAVVPGNDADRNRIVNGIAALLSGSPASPEETFFVVRRFLAALADTRPVVLVIDDLHWAEPLLLDLVEHLVQWGSGVPLFVLAGARPELRDARSSLTTSGGVVADVVTLAGLDAGAAMRLAANMVGAPDLPAAIAGKVLASSEGNPLFVGELVRMLVHEGALKREGDRWTVGVGLAALEMPPTIHALLAARIERLRPEDRTVLERAAVVGRHFSRSAVSALLPRDVTDLDGRLESLRRSELIERDTGWFLGEPVLRFHHLLIRDAAYRRLLKGTRAELHGKLAEWIEARAGDAVEHDETLGWHLEQSYLHLRELGPLDDRGRATGEKAAHHLAAAGRRSLARDDLSLAAGLLGRALPCLDTADASRAELALDWCEAVLAAGDVTTATAAIAELDRFTAGSPRLRAWRTCFSGQLTALTAPQSLHETADAVAAAAEVLAALGDDAGEAKGHAVHAQALARLGRVGACEAALDRALAAARRAGDRRRANAVLAGAPVAALWGPSPVTRASGRCLDVVRVLRITQGAPAVEAVALSCQGVLEALRGRTDAAKRMIALSRQMVEELGISHRLYEADVFAGRIDLLEGDAQEAERRLRSAFEGLRELGLGIDAARAAALLARALLALDRADEAEALSHESEILAGDDLQAAIAWRGVRAEALARRGEQAAAVEFAEASVAIAAATDALLDHADARLALAAALRASGRAAEAGAEEKRAIELWEAKGATLLAERARISAATANVHAPQPDARAARAALRDTFEPEDIAAVHAHLDKVLPAKPVTQRPARPRVRPNAATRNVERFAAAFGANDVDAVAELYAADVVNVHHVTGVSFDKASMVESWKSSGTGSNPSCEAEALASFGETLCLARQSVRLDGIVRDESTSIGPVELEMLLVIEVNAQELRRRNELFATNHLEDAIVRLYELRAESLPERAGRESAAATAKTVQVMLEATHDMARFAAVLSPDLAFEDHRRTGSGRLVGAAAVLENLQAFEQLSTDLLWRTVEILHLGESSLAVRGINTGKDIRSGGEFERRFAFLWQFGPDGLLTHMEVFEPEDAERVFARLGQLAPHAPATLPASDFANPDPASRASRPRDEDVHGSDIMPPSPWDNAASRAWRHALVRWRAGGSQAGESLLADEFRYSDRRRISQVDLDRDGFVRFNEALRAMPSHKLDASLLATRGERFCMIRIRLEVAGEDVGPSEIEHLNVVEVNENGAPVALIRFDLDDAEAAAAELESRFQAEEAVRHSRVSSTFARHSHARDRRDWDALAAQFHPDMVTNDRRVLGWGTLHDRDAFVQTQKALVDLAPDARFQHHHIRASEHGHVTDTVISGTRDGGQFELSNNAVLEIDGQGLICRFDIYDSEDHERAFARFRSIDGPAEAEQPAAIPRSNAATEASTRYRAAAAAADWDALRAMLRPDAVYEDRRGHAQVSGGVELWIEQERLISSSLFENPRVRRRVEGLAGKRIAVENLLFTGGPADAPVEVEILTVNEVDEEGRVARAVTFNPDQRREAQREALRRWIAIDPDAPARVMLMSDLCEIFDRQDAEAWRASFKEGFSIDDHRLVGLGRIDDVNAYTDSLRALWDLAPETTLDGGWFFPAYDCRGWVTPVKRSGNLPDGGAFESAYLMVHRDDDDGSSRGDLFDADAIDAAIACFQRGRDSSHVAAPDVGHDAATHAQPRTPEPNVDSRGIPSNAATRMHAKLVEAHAARDWDGIRRFAGNDFRFEDRGKRVLVDGDVETWIKSMEYVASHPGVRFEHELLATLGDRILIQKLSWIGESHEAEFLTDKLRIIEVAADGELRRIILFDLDDRPAAFAEALERFAAGEAKGADGATTYARFARAVRSSGWSDARDVLSPEFVLDDRRPLSLGVLDRDQWIQSLRVQKELAPDFASDVVRVVAWNRRGFVLSLRHHGNIRDGGPFENVLLSVVVASGGKLTHIVPYPVDAREEALARFEELCAALDGDSHRGGAAAIPPSSAMRAATRFFEVLWSEGDDRAAALVSPAFRYQDRGRRALLEGDVRTWIGSIRFLTSQSRTRFERLATIGDRVVISMVTWTGRAGGPEHELDRISLLETDDAGRICSVTLFDLEDRRTAMWEGRERFAAGEAAGADGPTTYNNFGRAIQREDWEAASEYLSPSLRFDDHRPLSLGVLDGKQWLESIRIAKDMAPDYASDVLEVLAWNSRGYLISLNAYGTLRDGGPFENLMLSIFVASGGKLTHVEPYPVDARAEALARFEELTRDPFAVAPNAATRTTLQATEDFIAGNWQVFRKLCRCDFAYEDRSRRALVTGDVETWITSMQFVRENFPTLQQDTVHNQHELIATFGDRIELRRFLFVGGPDDARIELERLRLTEIDEQGRLRAVIFFDPEDRAAACLEGLRRFVLREAAETLPAVECFDALQRHDWDALRDVSSDALVFDDHRPLSFGTIDLEQWIESLGVQAEMAPDFTTEPLHVIAWNRHGLVTLGRTYGTLRNGGAFENLFAVISMTADGRLTRSEPFPPGEAAKAVARFEELCAALDAAIADDASTASVTTA